MALTNCGWKLATFLAKRLPSTGKPSKLPLSQIGKSNKVLAENYFVPVENRVSRRLLHELLATHFRVKDGRLGNQFWDGYLWIPDGTRPEAFAVRIANHSRRANNRGIEVETLTRWN